MTCLPRERADAPEGRMWASVSSGNLHDSLAFGWYTLFPRRMRWIRYWPGVLLLQLWAQSIPAAAWD
jgi:hypothetical protein